jgi:AhpD family alkylhydroperoxidase
MRLAPPATNRLRRKVRASDQFDRELLELVKLRASLINGCACCAGTHTEVARTSGSPGRGRRQ